jgi:hypothetical protein
MNTTKMPLSSSLTATLLLVCIMVSQFPQGPILSQARFHSGRCLSFRADPNRKEAGEPEKASIRIGSLVGVCIGLLAGIRFGPLDSGTLAL